MNKVILTGNATRDAELRYTQGANPTAYARFGLAVRRSFVRQGEQDVDFFNLTAWGPKAEFCEKWVRKGVKFNIVGRIEITTKEDENKIKHTYTNIVVEDIEFGESKASAESRGVVTGGGGGSSTSNSGGNWNPPTHMEEDDDLPF